MKTFKVYHPDYMGEAYVEIEARTHEWAAEKYAEQYSDEGNYEILKGGSIIVTVISEDESIVKKFEINGEASMNYYASEIE